MTKTNVLTVRGGRNHVADYGSRRIAAQLQREGMGINRKTVARYMQEMGIVAIYPGPNLSKRKQKEGV